MRNSITDIFFDLDHTLWDFEKNSALTFDLIFKKHGLPVDANDFIKQYAPINKAYWKLYREERVTKSKLRYGRLKDTFDSLRLDVEDHMIHLLSEDYITHLIDYNHLFEGVVEILEYLQPRYRMHIITNGFHEIQHRKLERSGILAFFEHIINSETVGVKKPNPLIFNAALKLAGVQPNCSLMIGDNLEADVQGAQGVGMQAIHFNSHSENKADGIMTIHNISELKLYL